MADSVNNQGRCNHCGGAIINRYDDTVCVMCGRNATHKCDLCQFVTIERALKDEGDGNKPARKRAVSTNRKRLQAK
jgi:hypothetical protein